GSAFRFAIMFDGQMIGVIDVDEIADGEGSLGYWLDEPHWGKGFAVEAAQDVVRFSFEKAGLHALFSGHAADNEASGSVLTKLGFRHTEDVEILSRSRGETILQ